jgi:amidase
MFKDYTQYDALGLAELIRSKQVSSEDVLEAAIHQTNLKNPSINAVIDRFDDRARAQVVNPDAMFAGVPFLLKDLGGELVGTRYSMGSSISMISKQNSVMTDRFLKSGLLIFGKTNLPEFGSHITTEPLAFGATHNPHKQGYSAGGSSGGSAAAVASGMVPVASASDGGGSIRIPAAWCGVFGLKTSRGRNPTGPDLLDPWSGAAVEHVISRSVRDSAAMLDATHGSEAGSISRLPSPEGGFLAATKKDPKPLKILLNLTPLMEHVTLDKDVKEATLQAAKDLEALGHKVELVEDLGVDPRKLWRSFLAVVSSHTEAVLAGIENQTGKSVRGQIEAANQFLAMIGRGTTGPEVVAAQDHWHQVRRQMDQHFADYDLVLCPTAPTTAPKLGALTHNSLESVSVKFAAAFPTGRFMKNTDFADRMCAKTSGSMAFTVLANATGLPAVSLPLAKSPNGLPIGVQLIAPMGDEATLLSVSAQMERAGLFIGPAF